MTDKKQGELAGKLKCGLVKKCKILFLIGSIEV
jgi:hypothetical protein